MSNSTPIIAEGATYLVIYEGGPFDGQTETRVSTDGGYDAEIDAYAAIDGEETHLVYNAVSVREVGDTAHVTYALDRPDSDPIKSADERGGGFE